MTEMEHPEDLYQVALLIDQLKHEDVMLRSHAIRNLPRIAKALGVERTKSELIPFLAESADDDDDIMIALAQSLGMLAPILGDANLSVLLIPLEVLMSAEDGPVRDAALQALVRLLERNSAEFIENVANMYSRLATKDWHTSRMSAAMMYGLLFKYIGFDKEAPKLTFFTLCEDESALVRRLCILALSDVVSLMDSANDMNDILKYFRKASEDDQDNVRIQAITLASALLSKVSSDLKTTFVLPIVFSLSGDRSWRVRWSFCSKFGEICSNVEPVNSYSKKLGTVFENLLTDMETEVRAAAACSIAQVSAALDKEIVITQIIPAIPNIINDPSEHVRVSLAVSISGMALSLSKSDVIDRLLPIILLLLRDESAEVRLSIISSLEAINNVVGVDMLSQALLPSMIELAEDTKWRIRLAIIELIPKLANQLGREFFNEKLNSICAAWLNDVVYSVRKAAVSCLCQLIVCFGDSWAKDHVIPRLERMIVHTNYLFRITAVQCIETLLGQLPMTMVEQFLVPLLKLAANDAVANVRMSFVKCVLGAPKSSYSDGILKELKPMILLLSTDNDPDVRFVTAKAKLVFG